MIVQVNVVLNRTVQWRIPGRGLGPTLTPLLLDQTEAQRAEKIFWRPKCMGDHNVGLEEG